MADSFIQVPPDSTGKLVDAEQLTVGSNTVQRQRHEISGASAAEIVRVLNSQPAGSEYGIVVREAQKGQAAMASSQPVVIASDQSKILVTPDALPANQSVNVAQVAGTTTDTNSGTKSAGTQRVVIATDQPALTNALKVDGSAVTQPVSGTVTTSPPSNASTNVAQLAGTATSVNSGNKDAGTLRVVVATDQPALTNPLLVTQVPGTSGGDSVSHLISAASTNATNVKASAGQVFGWSIFNTNAATRYVKLHNSAGTPTAGSGVVYTIAVPPSGGSNLSIPDGLAFSTGIAFTAVTGTADSDSTGVGANDLVINIHYK